MAILTTWKEPRFALTRKRWRRYDCNQGENQWHVGQSMTTRPATFEAWDPYRTFWDQTEPRCSPGHSRLWWELSIPLVAINYMLRTGNEEPSLEKKICPRKLLLRNHKIGNNPYILPSKLNQLLMLLIHQLDEFVNKIMLLKLI